MALLLEIYRGNTDTRTVTVTSGGVAFDLAGYVLKFIAKANYSIADADAEINKEITVSAPATGVGVLALTHADTDINPGDYICEIKLYTTGGSFIKTLDVGKLTIKKVVLLEV